MSVIRRPEVLGQSTRRRVLGATAAITAATIEILAVGTWFALVMGSERTVPAALGGLGVLVVGSVLRTGVFDAATVGASRVSRPQRLVPAIVHAACWPLWLLTAERIGGRTGIAAGAVVLALSIAVQYELERRTVAMGTTRRASALATVVPGALVALGATALLAATWFANWSVVTIPVSISATSYTLEIGPFALAFLVFGALVFAAQERRFQHELADY